MKSIAIIGAGPYGLAVAATLRAEGLEPHVFGEVMSFWQRHMPDGMLLRSSWDASHIGHPDASASLSRYEASRGVPLARPIPLADFVAYGQWFRRQTLDQVDPREVISINRRTDHFRLLLADGDEMQAERVVVAAGIARFAVSPEPLRHFSGDLVSHSSEHARLDVFAGRSVIVVGGGQSAVETAALLSEAGANVELVVRSRQIRWLRRSRRFHGLPAVLRSLLYARTDVGPIGLSQLVAHPSALARLPLGVRENIARRAIRPAASAWLFDRVDNVRVTYGTQVQRAVVDGSRIAVDFGAAGARVADHVICATGYRVDIARYPFIGSELLSRLVTRDGAPILDASLQSSVPGLHFVGAASAFSFGPVARFVSGTAFAADAIVRAVAGEVRPRSCDITYAGPLASAEK